MKNTTHHNSRYARSTTRTLATAIAVLLCTAASAVAQPALLVQQIDPFETVNAGDNKNFGQVVQGEQASKQFILFNNGDQNMTVQSVTALGAFNFEWDAVAIGGATLPRVLPPGSQMNISVTFAPPAFRTPPTSAVILSIDTNAPDAPFQFQVSGTILEEPLTSAMQLEIDGLTVPNNGTFDLGDLLVGETVDIEMFADSFGALNLTLFGIQMEGDDAADFTVIDAGNTQVPPGQSEDLLIELTPSTVGQLTATARINNDSLQNPYRVTFTATVHDDCNGNNVFDSDDIADGFSEDCNADGVPDECEADSDNDLIIDGCDVCPGQDDLIDDDADGTPDCLQQQDDDSGNNGNDDDDDDNDDNDDGNDNDDGDDDQDDDDDLTPPLPAAPCGMGTNMVGMAMIAGFASCGMRRRQRTTRTTR